MTLEKGSLVEGEITSIAFGGEGILRDKGFVVFVPLTAVGDRITAKLNNVKRSHAYAELVEILEKGEGRITARCPHYRVCGGCQLQHLDAKRQLAYKRDAINDSFKRIGKLDLDTVIDVLPASETWGYRRSIRLSMVAKKGDGYSLGYVRRDLDGIISIRECPIFLDKEISLLSDLQSFVGSIKALADDSAQLTVMKMGSDSYALHFVFPENQPKDFPKLITEALKVNPSWQGASVTEENKQTSYGNLAGHFSILDMQITYDIHCFVQTHASQSEEVYKKARQIALDKKAKRILDLYCGIGVSALIFARDGAQVLGVEGNKYAVAMAQRNAEANAITNSSFQVADINRTIHKLLSKHRADFVFVNPPRTGLTPQVIKALSSASPATIVYVSCMPSTLARDVAKLCKNGYKIASASAYDMFPQTAHLETFVVLDR
jgi:23S rRNA (uracil1939-C5)-methyltransferase